jgi:predicted GNAT superfamily acetyltransferase
MGTAFLDEPWTKVFLDGIKANGEKRTEFSTLMFEYLVGEGARTKRVYTLPDGSAAMIAYRHTEQELDNQYYEDKAIEHATNHTSLDSNHVALISSQQTIMAPISDFAWEEEFTQGNDFIHVARLAVSPDMRGKGKVRELLAPLFAFADENRLPIFTETFGDETQALAEHLGFDTLQMLECDMPVKLSIDFGEKAKQELTRDAIFRELENLGAGGSGTGSSMPGGFKLKKETIPFAERLMGRRPQFNLR